MTRLSRTLGWGMVAVSLMAFAATAGTPSPAGFPPVVVKTADPSHPRHNGASWGASWG